MNCPKHNPDSAMLLARAYGVPASCNCDQDELEALIPSMRQSAQDTLAALHRSGFKIARATS